MNTAMDQLCVNTIRTLAMDAAAGQLRAPRAYGAGAPRLVVETAGIIRDMGRDDNGVAYIRLATANEFVSVKALFGKAEHESLQTGETGKGSYRTRSRLTCSAQWAS